MSLTIENQIALVTGSNRGIGRAIVEELLSRGAKKIYAAARNTDTLSELVAQYPDQIVPVALDVTDPQQITAAAEKAPDATLLINNAGYLANNDLVTGDMKVIRDEFEINYFGPLELTRAFAPILGKNGGGAIINISSVAGLSNFPAIPSYSDSKAAVHSLTSASRLLLASQGTHVLGVYPGPVDTEMAAQFEIEKATPQSVAAKIVDGLEQGQEDIFPDTFAENYRAPYEAGQKTLEKNIAESLQQPA